jgi:hypothetical protein
LNIWRSGASPGAGSTGTNSPSSTKGGHAFAAYGQPPYSQTVYRDADLEGKTDRYACARPEEHQDREGVLPGTNALHSHFV